MTKLFGPGYHVLPGGAVRFVLDAPEACQVRVAGDFTAWDDHPLSMHRREHDGLWEVETPPLERGPHFYLFKVDDAWIEDPAHPIEEDNTLGGWNSAFGIDDAAPLGGHDALRVVTLNLQCWQQRNASLKLDQIAYSLHALDVHAIALQEVGEHVSDPGRPNAGAYLRLRLEAYSAMKWHHAWRYAHIGFREFREGLSLLAREPLEEVEEFELGPEPMRRIVLSAKTRAGDRDLRLANVHLSLDAATNAVEAQRLFEWTRGVPHDRPLLVLGDLNAEGNSASLAPLEEWGFADAYVAAPDTDDGPTFYGEQPERRIDFQLLRSRIDSVAQTLSPLAYRRAFDRNVVGTCYLPWVSDHVGVLVAYD